MRRNFKKNLITTQFTLFLRCYTFTNICITNKVNSNKKEN